MRTPPQVYHWRSHSGAEVDLLLERDGIFWPIEVKAAARVTRADARGIHAFCAAYPHVRHGVGIIVAAVEETSRLSEDILVVPCDLP
jgi:predicted AAA+ superfamily ATPase